MASFLCFHSPMDSTSESWEFWYQQIHSLSADFELALEWKWHNYSNSSLIAGIPMGWVFCWLFHGGQIGSSLCSNNLKTIILLHKCILGTFLKTYCQGVVCKILVCHTLHYKTMKRKSGKPRRCFPSETFCLTDKVTPRQYRFIGWDKLILKESQGWNHSWFFTNKWKITILKILSNPFFPSTVDV